MENKAISETKSPFIPVPTAFVERVALNLTDRIVYVDKRCAGDPHLLSWQDRNKHIGHIFHIRPADVDEVSKLRQNGFRADVALDDDLAVRNAAIEIIKTSAEYGASDIHLMMRGGHSEVQIVVKGGLRVLKRLSQSEGNAIARALYQGVAKTRDSSFNPLDFQNAQIPGDGLPGHIGLTSIRIVRGPCYPQDKDGSFLTMRLQYATSQITRKESLPALELPRRPPGQNNLEKMGYTESQVEKIKTLMDAPNGMIIFTGPTGSGKTTAMFEALQDAARTKPHRRLVTVEDPVEYPMEWAVQMAVTGARNDSETGAAFGERIRVALRMAPNIILLGELRGPDVAVSALEASVTGHQVWTTMHVTDPFLFVERMELMDQERLNRKVFCDHKIVRGVIAQRLLPKLCPHCSVPLSEHIEEISHRVLTALQSWGDISKVRINGGGCQKCGFDGTSGRFAVAEVVVMAASTMSDFIEHGSDIARKNHRARKDSDPSMLESAIMHTLEGIVDPRAVEDSVDLIEEREIREPGDERRANGR